MTRTHASTLWPFIKAFAEGKTIQCRFPDIATTIWTDVEDPTFNFNREGSIEYRIKPEPFETWVRVDDDIVVASSQNLNNLDAKYGGRIIKMREVCE